MKRMLALLLVAVMAFALAACGGTPTSGSTTPPTSGSTPAGGDSSTPAVENDKDTLTVGTPELNGDFIYDFTNNSYDKYVKDLTSGEYYYATVTFTPDDEFIINPITIESHTVTDDAEGNRTYTFKLFEDLKWNDGSDLKAFDYVFSALVRASREWLAQGTTATQGDSWVGYTEYHTPLDYAEPKPELDEDGNPVLDEDGNEIINEYTGDEIAVTEFLKGVALVSDYEFSVTIDGSKLPYFYEYMYAFVAPLCSAVWAPGCDIETTEEGSRITGVDLSAALANVAGTERYAPSVTCGPYSFVSNENSTVTLVKNEFFKGDQDGELPKFQNVVVKYINQDTDADQVIAGEVDLVNGAIEGDKIEAVRASDTASLTSYKRYGYGMIAFHTDFGPTRDPNVRWGLASLIDRSEVLDYVLGGYGGTVDGPYGLAMWQYQERQAELQEQMRPISFNIDAANTFLDASDYKFEADGSTPFDASKAVADATYLRHNAAGEPLTIQHMGSENNDVTRAVQSQFQQHAGMAGVDFKVTEADFATLLDNYYYGFRKGDDRVYHSFNLANGFDAAYDPYYGSDHSDFAGTQINSTQIADDALDAAIEKMRELEPTQTEEHADAFVEYIVRWNELLPSIPLYSNEYFDFYHNSITGIVTTPFVSWAQTVCKIAPAA